MPAWWGKKSTKNGSTKESESPKSDKKSSIRETSKKPKSFDEGIFSRNSPRNSRDFLGSNHHHHHHQHDNSSSNKGSSSGGFSGFDSSSSSMDRGHPLPRPSVPSSPPSIGCGVGGVFGGANFSDHHNGAVLLHQGGGLGSGSVSVSSVSSSGSSDDQQHTPFRVHGDSKLSPRARSPGPGARGMMTSTSPLHQRISGVNLDSPTGRLEDGKSECHKLPLPPGPPSSPSALPSPKPSAVAESSFVSLSKWKKGRLLGRGTFGHVYLGFNSENGQMCAIKEVKVVADDQSSKESLKQLNQEITLLSSLSHPNIVQYYGSELCEETLSVYLEYVSGGSIHKLLQEYGPFREPVIQNYARQILCGLSYLHGRNTVHRDIKGANILVDPNGEIKLADFGMAKHITSCTSVLSFKGSPYWMAPEVVMNSNGYSLSVDIWSLGCTILEMATSKPPWSQFEGVAAIFKIGNSKDIPEIPEHLSGDAKSFIRLCLQRDPSARPTASELLEHPFVREQTTPRSSNVNITKDAFPHAFDGSRSPRKSLELHSNRMYFSSDADYSTKHVVPASRALVSPREAARTITSLPVSPCSSPLRQYGPAHKSCFLSPPHPSYAFVGQGGYNLTDYSMLPTRPNTRSTLEPWLEIPQFKAQTPGRSHRTRTIL